MKNKKFLAVVFAAAMSMALVACGGSDDSDANANAGGETNVNTEAQAGNDAADQEAEKEDAASNEAVVSDVTYGLNYVAEPDAYVGKWVLAKAYTAEAGDLAVPADACYLEIEKSIDTNKLVDEAAYTHADAINLKGNLTFNHEGIDSEGYSCTGAWSDWTVVDVVGEGEAYFKGAIKFKVRDDDEGVYFDVLTGTTVEDMELFDVLGITADGQLVLGYSEDHIEKAGDAEWAYAYIFDKAE